MAAPTLCVDKCCSFVFCRQCKNKYFCSVFSSVNYCRIHLNDCDSKGGSYTHRLTDLICLFLKCCVHIQEMETEDRGIRIKHLNFHNNSIFWYCGRYYCCRCRHRCYCWCCVVCLDIQLFVCSMIVWCHTCTAIVLCHHHHRIPHIRS